MGSHNKKLATVASLSTLGAIAAFATVAFSQDGFIPLPGPTISPSPTITPTEPPEILPTTEPAFPVVTPSPATPSPSPTPLSGRIVLQATLLPINGSGVTGTAEVVIDGGNDGVSITASGLAPNIAHKQHIHSGTACADLSADTNGDGLIDAVEAAAISGKPVIPLTLGKIDPGEANLDRFPIASLNGNVTYVNSAQTDIFNNAIKNAPTPTLSPVATPAVTPTPGTDPLEGKVVEIHGLDPGTALPASVQSERNEPATVTIPVACGVLTRVAE